ncbi:hypothetical protein [Halorussus ruber]|uniref:hypothetical protein n=1 Tax=Halorussus ruber TaxID=1126238 RepID=UPI0010920624|nr:hypothetical protein [Halorussus ruber]
MSLVEIDDRRYFPMLLLFVGLLAFVLFGASYFVEVRIIVEKPRYGDVTETIRALWRAILGATTIGSFLVGVYALHKDDDSASGPPTKVEIKGTGHDIDVYPNGPVGKRDGENERDDTQDDTVASEADPEDGENASDECSESNTVEDQRAD